MIMLPFLNSRKSFHTTSSNSNIAVMKSFGTGRVYVRSNSCLAMTMGVILVALLFILIGASRNRISFEGYLSFNNQDLMYGIMIDAGSTGSRVHVYKFLQIKGTEIPWLKDEVFEQVKPGLSSYAERPEKGVESIKELLDIAKENIPENKWSSTPLALKATAGLRLLPGEQAQVLLEKVKELFRSSPFLLPKDDVKIMDGVNEGIFAWVTVNYLLQLFGESSNTVGTIDLGGGSMQITFQPKEKETLNTSPKDFIHDTEVFNKKMKMYVHSYLGLGLMSAREAVIGGPKQSSTIVVSSSCLPEGYSGEWTNAQTRYKISGAKSGSGKYDACYSEVKKAIQGKINRPDELKRQTFYAFSYIFDRASECGIIHPEKGGVVSVATYEDTTQNLCNKGWQKDSPFLCMDLTIITSMLRDGFGFSRDVYLNIRKKIEGKENSWALGATFYLLNERLSK